MLIVLNTSPIIISQNIKFDLSNRNKVEQISPTIKKSRIEQINKTNKSLGNVDVVDNIIITKRSDLEHKYSYSYDEKGNIIEFLIKYSHDKTNWGNMQKETYSYNSADSCVL